MDTLTIYLPLANHWQICLPLSNALSFSWLFEMYELVCAYLPHIQMYVPTTVGIPLY